MRHSLHILASVALASMLGCSRGATETLGESFDAGAVFVETTPKVTHRFRLSHRADRAVTIKNVKRSCACTAATVDKMTISPGETVELTMTVAAKPIYTDQSVFCTLETDHPSQPDWTYRLLFRTYPRIRFNTYTIELGSVPNKPADGPSAEIVKTGWLEIYEPSTRPITPAISFDLDSRPNLSVRVGREPDTGLIEGGTIRLTRYPVSVALDRAVGRDEPSGTFTETVTARAEPGMVASTIVSWTRSASLEVSPSNLSFGILNRPGDRSSKRVILRSRNDHPFRVLSAVGGAEEVSVGDQGSRAPSGLATSQVVELTYQRGPASRRFASGQAVIRTDHPEMPSMRVSWSAIAP